MFVGGRSENSLFGASQGREDAWVARYDRAGIRLWGVQFGTSEVDRLESAAADESGGVFVCGQTAGVLGTNSAGGTDTWVAHFDDAGELSWIRQLGTPGYDVARDCLSDGVGGVYVCGITNRLFPGQTGGGTLMFDAWLARYDSAGNQAWLIQWGTQAHDTTAAMTTDGAGGVILGGNSYGDLGAPNLGGADGWMARYDSAGNRIWIEQFGTSSSDIIRDLASDGSGGAFACGETDGGLGGPNLGDADGFIAHFDGAGQRTWLRQFGSPLFDGAVAIGSDHSGGAYVGVRTDGDLWGPKIGPNDHWLTHYDSAGNRGWTQQLGGFIQGYPTAVISDGSDGLIASGTTRTADPTSDALDVWLVRYDTLGTSRDCSPAVVNSSGFPATIDAVGSGMLSKDDLTVVAEDLPAGSWGYFLCSLDQGFAPGAGGGQGTLCLGGAVGRFLGPGQVQNSGSNRAFSMEVDPTVIPQPTGAAAMLPAQTWFFQAWYRDANPNPTSNFTDAVSLSLQ